MPWPRHLLQSVEISAVTQSRVSDDYTPGNSQWQIGDTTILAHALGLAAFKDVSTYDYSTVCVHVHESCMHTENTVWCIYFASQKFCENCFDIFVEIISQKRTAHPHA